MTSIAFWVFLAFFFQHTFPILFFFLITNQVNDTWSKQGDTLEYANTLNLSKKKKERKKMNQENKKERRSCETKVSE